MLILLLWQLIKAGEGVIAATQSGNRDEDVFPEADTFNLHRKRGPEKALGFGYGEHQCIAESLARAELEIVFGKSVPYLSGVSLNDGVISVTDVGGWHCFSNTVPEAAKFEACDSARGGEVLTANEGCRDHRAACCFLDTRSVMLCEALVGSFPLLRIARWDWFGLVLFIYPDFSFYGIFRLRLF